MRVAIHCSCDLLRFVYSFLFIGIKTPSFKGGEYGANCACDECFMALRDVVSLLITKSD